MNVVWFTVDVEFVIVNVMLTSFVSVAQMLMQMPWLFVVFVLFAGVGEMQPRFGRIESVKKVIVDWLRLPAESLMYMCQVLVPCDEDNEVMLVPQAIVVFVCPELVE